ncbi:MAG: PspC domain-containing protein [Candidatus Limnocylindria bacterium]
MSKRLYRSRTDVVWTGVAGGLAQWIELDPSLVRVAWVILVPLTGGIALFVYLVMWIVVPEEPAPVASETPAGPEPSPAAVDTTARAPAEPPPRPPAWLGSGSGTVLAGIGLILLGAFFLVREYLPAIDWGRLWPIVVIAIGAALLIGSLRGRDST